MLYRLTAAMLMLAPPAAFANDSTAELGTGGLVLGRTDAVQMKKEDLFISPDRVTVDYVFHNVSETDVETIVAFPMPDILGSPYELPMIPKDPDDNFLGFKVSVEGKAVTPQLEQRAFAAGVDISKELEAQKIPFYPNGEATIAALSKLGEAVAEDWIDRGIIIIDEYDDGSGWKRVRSPYWLLRSTYWWRTKFPAGRDVRVHHDYTPSLGSSAGLNFFSEGKIEPASFGHYKEKYCVDKSITDAVLRSAKASPEGYPQLYETRISYVLTTGGNWATGSIGDFTLTVDKGDAKALVSFCGTDVKKIGPTTFQMKAADYYPAHDVDILILKEWDWADRSAPLAEEKKRREGARLPAAAAPKK